MDRRRDRDRDRENKQKQKKGQRLNMRDDALLDDVRRRCFYARSSVSKNADVQLHGPEPRTAKIRSVLKREIIRV